MSDQKIQHKDDGSDLPDNLRRELKKLQEQFTVSPTKLKEITTQFRKELELGLQEDGQNIAMYVTWVLGFPSGKETGSFLTIDLGGTNLRCCWITLKGSHEAPSLEQHKYQLPDDIKTGKASTLWSFIADSLERFIEDQGLEGTKDDPLRLGFTFSYPAIQDYIDHGVLQTWTKGFDIDGVEGKDVASQLRDAISSRRLPIELVAVVNDTTGAMIASAYNDPDTIIGAIFGTGCNAAYMDKIGNISKLKNNSETMNLTKDTPMAINCEYGAFDNSRQVLPLTKFDEEIDRTSPRPGEQMFEKMSAGLYLGEIYRLILLDLHERGIAFEEQNIEKLREEYCIDTEFLSNIEDDESEKLEDSQKEFESRFDVDISQDELTFSRYVAKLIAMRGARLCATGIAAICQHQSISKGHVAADGSVANKHPKFKKRWARALGEILGWDDNVADGDDAPITITSAEDGSGIGAAVIAAQTLARWEAGQRAGIKAN